MDKEETQLWAKKHWNLVVGTAILNYEGGVEAMEKAVYDLAAQGPLISRAPLYAAANHLCKKNFKEYSRILWGPMIARG